MKIHFVPKPDVRIRVLFFAALLPWCVASASDPNSPVRPEDYSAPVRVACVGDSITLGVGTKVPLMESYPSQLQRMLGEKWIVKNFGNSGTTMLKAGDRSYWKQGTFKEAMAFNADVVIIKLGTNDSKPQNWKFKDQFSSDYKDMIAQFRALPSKPRIFICRPAFVAAQGFGGINEPVILEEIPLLDAVAKEAGAGIIDMHAALKGKDALIPDRVHPNADGAYELARTAYKALTGGDFSGTLDPVLRGEWKGFKRFDFTVDGSAAILILPKAPAQGNPWIWRTEFFGVDPQADVALIEKGWHVAYINVQNMYGSPASLDAMDGFYAQVTKQYQLGPKVVLEGFSRGGLYAFNWAARNPGKVACIYADAPVLDFKSWPAGKGKGNGSPKDWQQCLKAYGLSETQALEYKLNPIDNLKSLADAKIPILCVCGDADKTAPFEENTAIAQKRYQEFGGEIKVIIKPGADHHPHSLPDPTPIVEFISATAK